jgi:hypothetical protein
VRPPGVVGKLPNLPPAEALEECDVLRLDEGNHRVAAALGGRRDREVHERRRQPVTAERVRDREAVALPHPPAVEGIEADGRADRLADYADGVEGTGVALVPVAGGEDALLLHEDRVPDRVMMLELRGGRGKPTLDLPVLAGAARRASPRGPLARGRDGGDGTLAHAPSLSRLGSRTTARSCRRRPVP